MLDGSSMESRMKPVLYGSALKRTSSKTKNSASGPTKMVSPTPLDFMKASAFLAMPRGSRPNRGSPVAGSSTSQTIVMRRGGEERVHAGRLAGSGMRVMSDSLMAFQPAIDEPSNMTPSEKASSSTRETSKVTCCHLPRGSVKRKSTYLMSWSLMAFRTSCAVFMLCSGAGAGPARSAGCLGRLAWVRPRQSS